MSPRLIDLLAALGTGVVGSVALVRRDISDTLPGVAIAISLVPPLTVVGLTLEAGAWNEALGALLLFITNVVAIIATGIVVMSIYGVNKLVAAGPDARSTGLRKPAALLAFMLVVIGLPLSFTSIDIASKSVTESAIYAELDRWSDDSGWRLLRLDYVRGEVTIYLEGALPLPDTDPLESALVERGVDVDQVRLILVPVYEVQLGG